MNAQPPSAQSHPWLWAQTWGQTLAAGWDPNGLALRQRDTRLAQLREAAQQSPFYRQRLRGQPHWRDIAPVTKAELMAAFDDWACDRDITRASVDAFLHDAANLARPYLGRYLVWTSSGTSGHPGIFVQDANSLAAFDALDALRFRGLHGGFGLPQLMAPGQRCAMVVATGGHFAGVASVTRMQRLIDATMLRWLVPQWQLFSLLEPLPSLVRQLQAFAPQVLVTYPSCAMALAQLQDQGALQLRLRELWLGGEQLSVAQRTRLQRSFGAVLRNNYGASEFFSIAWPCAMGQLHLNHDWVLLEPVDAQLRPVPADTFSHTVLLTNLANHAQPLLRYQLHDSVRLPAQRCACGSGWPLIEVQGRSDDTLVLHDAGGRAVTLLPLALMTAIEEGAALTQFQLLRTGPRSLELRLEPEVPEPAAAFARARQALQTLLERHGLHQVRITRGRKPALPDPRSGKLRRVVSQPNPGT
jgi:phenylacetate-CoA ligase